MAGVPVVRALCIGDLPDRPRDPGPGPALAGCRRLAAPGGVLLATGQFYTPWSWLPRIIMQFTAGALAAPRSATYSSPIAASRSGYPPCCFSPASSASSTVRCAPAAGVSDSGGLVDILFVPLVLTLAIGTGSLPALLATRPFVYGGQISFCLYMVHELVHTSWIWTAQQFELTMFGNDGKWLLAAVLAVTFVGAAVLYHVVEEPARPLDAQDGRRRPGPGRRRFRGTERGRQVAVDRRGPRRPTEVRFGACRLGLP